MTNECKLAMAEKFLASLSDQDAGAVNALVTEEFVWTIVAPSMGAEPQRGRAAVDAMLAGLGAAFTKGALQVEVTRSAVDGDTVVVETHITADTLSGKRYDNWYVHWFELNNGLIEVWREHVDTKQAMDTLAD